MQDPNDELIRIDGNYLEGGGQIIRSALAFSIISGKPFIVENIRKGRTDPGLKAQHVETIKVLKDISDSTAKGDYLKSDCLTFYPGKIKDSNISVDIGTAGSITLLLCGVLPAIIHSKKRVRLKIRGGTDVEWSPCIDYFENNLLPILEQFSTIKLEVKRRGFFPKGGGIVDIQIKPKEESEGNFLSFSYNNPNKLLRIHGKSIASGELRESEVSERQAKGAKKVLSELGVKTSIETSYVQTDSIGTNITLWGEYENGNRFICTSKLGEIRRRAESIGGEAANKFLEENSLGACVDSYLADQLIPYMALFPGSSIKTSWITNHTLTNIYTIKQFLDIDFEVDKEKKIIRSMRKK